MLTSLKSVYMSYSNGLLLLLNFKSQTSGQRERGKPGVGFNLTLDGNYDMVNEKLANVADGTNPTDAITLNNSTRSTLKQLQGILIFRILTMSSKANSKHSMK